MGNMKLPSPDSHCGGGNIIYSSEYVLAALGEVPFSNLRYIFTALTHLYVLLQQGVYPKLIVFSFYLISFRSRLF